MEKVEKEGGDNAKRSDPPVGSESRYRALSGSPRYLSIFLTVLGTSAAIGYLFNIGVAYWGGFVVGTSYLHLILGLFLPQVFFHFPMTADSRHKLPWYDTILIILSFAIPFYYFLNGGEILTAAWEFSPPQLPFLFGIILWGIVLEATRRTVGWLLFFIVMAFSLYPLFAEQMPGLLYGPNIPLENLVGYNIMGPEGVIGLPTRILGTLFIGFMFFGVALTFTGASNFFLNIALSMLGTVRGGTAKVSILSSAMVGSISGSVITNVITTGSFTIPAMKKSGYPNHYAAAIETCASTGGVLMPPIMGAAAFVMAGMLNIAYAEVAIAAAIPSILYYTGLFVQVDGYAAKHNLKGAPRDELPSFMKTLKEGWFYVFAFAVLIYVLFVLRREAQAPFLATIPLLILTMFRKETRFTFQSFINFIEKVGKVLGEITGIMAGIGLFIGSLLLTGTAQTLSTSLMDMAAGNIYLLVLLGAIASFILGMGLTLTACYLRLAILLAPTLVDQGFYPLSIHIFLIYCGTLSFITPPVAIGAYAAAAVAGSNPMTTGLRAVRLGAVQYLVPLFIVFSPALILHGSLEQIILTVGTALLGVVLLASGIEGYLVAIGRLGILARICSCLSGVLLFAPNGFADIAGAGLATILAIKYLLLQGANREVAA